MKKIIIFCGFTFCSFLLYFVNLNAFANIGENTFANSSGKKHFTGIAIHRGTADFSYKTPAAGSILRWSDMKTRGVGGSYQFKAKSNIALGVDLSYSQIQSGFGTDDDMTNVTDYTLNAYGMSNGSVSGTWMAFSIHQVKGRMLDFNPFVKISANKYFDYGFGYSRKEHSYQMLGGYGAYYELPNNFIYLSKFKGNTQFTKATMQTIFASADFHPSENITFYMQAHTGTYKGDNDWQTYKWSLKSSSNYRPKNGYGFVFGLKGTSKINNKLLLTYFASIEQFQFKDLHENNLGYGGDYHLPSNYPSYVKFNRTNIGLGLAF